MTEELQIDITIADNHWASALEDVEGLCRTAARAAYQAAGGDIPTAAEVSLLLTDDRQVQELNMTYRDKNKPTNVLSFAALEGGPAFAHEGTMLGDIVIAFGVVEKEARNEEKPLADHLSHLVIHGMLHLLGHDHEDDREAEHMEALEISTLQELGIDNPYRALEQAGAS